MSFVKFENVYKRYKMGEITINAADGVSFEIEKGEFAVIVGASGAGKTTILNWKDLKFCRIKNSAKTRCFYTVLYRWYMKSV